MYIVNYIKVFTSKTKFAEQIIYHKHCIAFLRFWAQTFSKYSTILYLFIFHCIGFW